MLRGDPPPPAAVHAPALWPALAPLYEAFWLLSEKRQIALGFGAVAEQPITYEAISAFARDHAEWAPGTPAFALILHALTEMDRAYRAFQAERREQEASKRNRSGLILPPGM